MEFVCVVRLLSLPQVPLSVECVSVWTVDGLVAIVVIAWERECRSGWDGQAILECPVFRGDSLDSQI